MCGFWRYYSPGIFARTQPEKRILAFRASAAYYRTSCRPRKCPVSLLPSSCTACPPSIPSSDCRKTLHARRSLGRRTPASLYGLTAWFDAGWRRDRMKSRGGRAAAKRGAVSPVALRNGSGNYCMCGDSTLTCHEYLSKQRVHPHLASTATMPDMAIMTVKASMPCLFIISLFHPKPVVQNLVTRSSI